MELYVYNASLDRVGVADEVESLIWTRRFWDVGDVKLLAPATPQNKRLLRVGALLKLPGDDEPAVIRYVNTRKDAYGKREIDAQGAMLSVWPDLRVTRRALSVSGTARAAIRRIVEDNLANTAEADRLIPRLLIDADAPAGEPEGVYAIAPFASCLTEAKGIAKAAGLGFAISADARAKTFTFRVYAGRDMTWGSDAPRVFSAEHDNVLDETFTDSIENARTFAYVGGRAQNGDPMNRPIFEVGGGAGLERAEMFVNASDVEQAGNYAAAMAARGADELAKAARALSFSVRLNPMGNLRYRKHFNVGDAVTYVNGDLDLTVNARVTEAREVWRRGGGDYPDVEVIIGEALPSLKQLRVMS